MKNSIVASTSTLHGGAYLEYLLPTLQNHFKGCKRILFVPFARPGGITHEDYTATVQSAFKTIDIQVNGLHEFEDKQKAIEEAEAIFTGGGNTFLLVSQLYKYTIMDVLSETLKKGTPYLGTSAGSNICGLSMQTTNDMPIIYPPSFKTLGLVPFNLNPHYMDPDAQSKHMGETRETRIKEFHAFNTVPVLGLREGSWLEVKGEKVILKGKLSARLFEQNKEPQELDPESDLSFLN
ncbi:dipeptidase PepE [Flavobacterium sp. TAB 87]|uniref:dipeptidase PepE n=1 Tax=Flavobacterium sp. TAB 87 TaxID=1729581 RepID=UPI00076D389E|nr:dipeptidase PepE [Flavobacterium sp. TAB 87]KVV14416.1 Peptidase E [Flavobacterium sp. TAB 87]